MSKLNVEIIHPSWQAIIKKALLSMNSNYLAELEQTDNWLPGAAQIFNAFTLPLDKVKFILFGESPYPRAQSANGYAFWDQAVEGLWSQQGLSKQVNRATSLRNFIKMLLVARGDLENNTSQPAIASLNKEHYIETAQAFFEQMQAKGFLLLNASLVLSPRPVRLDAKEWRPFIASLLDQLALLKPGLTLLLWGGIAKVFDEWPSLKSFTILKAEHPYNISFINNLDMQGFFKPLDLLKRETLQ